MPNPWFKFFAAEYLSDPKIVGLSSHARSCWLTLLCYANVSPIEGKIFFIDEESLALHSGVNLNETGVTKGLYDGFIERGMITIEDGYIIILNWKKRQEMHMTDAQKQAKYRAKKKGCYESVTKVLPSVIEMYTLDTEEDTDTEVLNTSSSTDVDVDVYDTPGFKEFWDAYPNKRGKGQALKTWKKLKPGKTLQARILKSIEDHKLNDRQWKKDNGQFIPHPSTFLNSRRFDDVISTVSITSTADKF